MITNKTSRDYYDKYAAFYAVQPESFKAMALSIIKAQTDADPVEYLRISYENDRHLNNTFRNKFNNYDVHFLYTQRILKGHYGTGGLSLSDNVCLLKHAMIYHILGLEPEFTGESMYDLHVTPIAPADGGMIFLPFCRGATCWEAQFGRLWIRFLRPKMWCRRMSFPLRFTWCDKNGNVPPAKPFKYRKRLRISITYR